MRRLEILCDLDSVVVDLCSAWSKAYNDAWSDNLDLRMSTTWDTNLYVKQECGMKVFDYLTPDLFYNLQPLPGAIDAVNLIATHHDLHFITAAPNGTESAKVAWVKNHFPHLGSKVFTGKDKWKLRGDVLIDDGPHNLMHYKVRHPYAATVCLEYPYNKNCPVDFMAQDGFNTEAAWKSIISYLSWLE